MFPILHWLLMCAILTPIVWFAIWLDTTPTTEEFADDDSRLDLMDRPTG